MNSKKGLKIFNEELKSKIEENYNNKIIELRQYNNGVIGAFFKNGKFRFIGGKLSDEEKKKRAVERQAKKKAKQEAVAKKKADIEKELVKQIEELKKKKNLIEQLNVIEYEIKDAYNNLNKNWHSKHNLSEAEKKLDKVKKIKKNLQKELKKINQNKEIINKEKEKSKIVNKLKKMNQKLDKINKEKEKAKEKAKKEAKAVREAKKKAKLEAAAKKKAEKVAIAMKKAECKEKKMIYDSKTKDCRERKKRGKKPKINDKKVNQNKEIINKEKEKAKIVEKLNKMNQKLDKIHKDKEKAKAYKDKAKKEAKAVREAKKKAKLEAAAKKKAEKAAIAKKKAECKEKKMIYDSKTKDCRERKRKGKKPKKDLSPKKKTPKKNEKPKNKIPESCQNFNQIEIQSGWEPLGDIDTKFLIMLNVKDSENNDWKMCYNLIDLKEYINDQIKEKRKNIYLSIYRNEQDAAPALHHLLAEKEQDYSKMIKLNDKLLTKIKRAYNLLLKKNKKEVIQYYKENIGGNEEEIIKKLPFAELIDCDKEWKKKKNKAKIPCQYDRLVSAVISDHQHMIAFHIIHKSNLKILKDKYKHIDNGIHLEQRMYRDIIDRSKWTIEMPSVGFKYTDVKSNDYKYFKNNNNDKENYMKYCNLDSSQLPANVIITLNKLWDENKLLKYKNGKWIFNLEKMIGNHKNYENKIGLEYFNNRNEESKLTKQILEEGGVLPAGNKNKDIVNGGLGKWVSLSKRYDNSFDSENPNYSFYQLWKSFANTLNYMEYHESAEY